MGEAGFFVPMSMAAAELIGMFDTDSSGGIDFPEFCQLMLDYRKLEFKHLRETASMGAKEVLRLFKAFEEADADKSGSLDIQEVLILMYNTKVRDMLCTNEGMESFTSLFARIDLDRSLTLSFEEFLRLLRVWIVSCDCSVTALFDTKKTLE